MIEPNPSPPPTARIAALFDYDGTLIRGDSTLLLVLFAVQRYPRALGTVMKLAGALLPFLAGWKSREEIKVLALGALRHIPPGQRQAFFHEFHQRLLRPRILPGAAKRLAWHREQGHLLVIVSASVDLYLKEVAADLGMDHLICSRAVLDPTPGLLGPNCRGEEKVRRLREEPFAAAIRWEESWAYGDSLADRPLLEMCGHPVVVGANRELRRVARQEAWPILRW
jgi:HAD superfamily hydrolase (TIGR01490 family)